MGVIDTEYKLQRSERDMRENGAAVKMVDVTVGYEKTPILSHTNLEIGWGLIVGVLGPNGAGKSTLIKTILGTLKVFVGEVEVGGSPVRSNGARRAVGYVPQREVVNWDF